MSGAAKRRLARLHEENINLIVSTERSLVRHGVIE
jgi:hypothetical protein